MRRLDDLSQHRLHHIAAAECRSFLPLAADGQGRPAGGTVRPMLMLALLLVLLIVLVVMLVTRRHIGRLGSLATLIAAAMLALWLIDSGLVPGSKGPLEGDRATTARDR